MYKNIMIITSEFTGHGHKSITEALTEQFERYEDVKLNIIDGFALSGNLGLKIGKLYGSITRASKEMWKLIWDISLKKPGILIDLVENSIDERLLKILKNTELDAIVTTHPNYVGSVINILENNKMNIPLYAMVADPVSINPLWGDARAHYTICPTVEAKEACMGFGVPEQRIRVFGFPVRKRFCVEEERLPKVAYDPEKPLQCLIMSGGEGSGNMNRIAKNLLDNFNCKVTIICGRNKVLKRRIEITLQEKYNERVEILGFVNDIQDLMLKSDLLFLRASPNTMMEAVMCNLPMVITGALPGQEEGNPDYAEKYKLGVVCTETRRIKRTVKRLLANNADKLNKIKQAQLEYRDPYIAKNIVDFIMNS
jgi:UDP-N-acetylglucosamine:LPS N-acetylglucosamine transferase